MKTIVMTLVLSVATIAYSGDDLPDLDGVIARLQGSVVGSPSFSTYIMLGRQLEMRGVRRSSIDDLNSAAQYFERAISMTSNAGDVCSTWYRMVGVHHSLANFDSWNRTKHVAAGLHSVDQALALCSDTGIVHNIELYRTLLNRMELIGNGPRSIDEVLAEEDVSHGYNSVGGVNMSTNRNYMPSQRVSNSVERLPAVSTP